MSPSPGRRRSQAGPHVSVHLRWSVLGLLALNAVLWAVIIGALRRVFS